MKPQDEIIPMMKVAELLELYPDTEGKLLELSPALERLKDPALRTTVAEVTTLAQAARSGEADIGQFIQELRVAAGISVATGGAPVESCPDHDAGSLTGTDRIATAPAGPAAHQEAGRPAWVTETGLTGELDARPVLARGDHPLERVLADLSGYEPGQVYRLTTPFLPAPLLERVRARGFECWSEEAEPGRFESWFRKE